MSKEKESYHSLW